MYRHTSTCPVYLRLQPGVGAATALSLPVLCCAPFHPRTTHPLQGLTHAAGPPASSDFQALCAAWCSGQLCPTFSHLVEAVAAAVLSRLMPATSTAAASFRQLLLPLVQAAMRWQVVVLACHAGLRIVVDGWDSCRSSSGSLQQLVQGLKPLDRELHSAAGAPVSVTIEHTAESQQIQLVLLCTKPGVVWASHQGGAPAQPIGAVQEVKLLQVRCSSEHLAAPSKCQV